MMKARLALAVVVALLAAVLPAAAQSNCSNIRQGAVLTPAQWNQCFAAKNDLLPYTPVNRAGDTMTGRLGTVASTTTRAGFNVPPGVAPTSPVNGDIWTTSSGFFVQINGSTVSPMTSVLASGRIFVGNGSNVATAVALSGDATLSNAGAITVTKTGGVAFGSFATGTDAANLSGTVASGRLSGSYTGITGVGTLTAGATGVGFTVALGSSTVTGSLAAANGGFGSSISGANGVPVFATGVPTFTPTSGSGNIARVSLISTLPLTNVLGLVDDLTTVAASNVTITSASTSLTVAGASFASTDCLSGGGCTGTANKLIIVKGAGAAGADLFTSIVNFTSPTQVTLGNAAGTTLASGRIGTLGAITAGTGYVDATYSNVPLTGGAGTGATANITVTSGAVSRVVMVNPGSGYAVANTLSASNANLGGAGAGFSVPVSTIGVPVPYGSDNTSILQTAVNSNPVSVLPPTTNCLSIGGQITMPNGAKLLGYSQHGSVQATAGDVTKLGGTCVAVMKDSSTPFAYTNGNAINGLTLFYPGQLSTQSAPIAYPATIAPSNCGAGSVNNDFSRLIFVNAYHWIDASCAHLDFHMNNLEGAPIYRGIIIDQNGGTDQVHDVNASFYYWTDFAATIEAYIRANAILLSIGRSDAFSVQNIYAGSMDAVLLLYRGASGCSYGSIKGIYGDGVNYGIYAECTQGVGVNVVDLEVNATINAIENPASSADSVTLNITNFLSWTTTPTVMHLGSPNTSVSVANGRFQSYTTSGITVDGANIGTIELMVSGTQFNSGAVLPINTSSGTLKTLQLMGNNFSATPSFAGTPATNVKTCGNINLGSAC